MYIQIGTKDEPANIKTAGGFIAETPIAKIISSTIINSSFYGTPIDKFKKPLTDFQKLSPTINITVAYFKSYEDYLNVESPILLNIDPALSTVTSTNIQNNYSGLPLLGDITEKAFYDALLVKLSEQQENVKIVVE